MTRYNMRLGQQLTPTYQTHVSYSGNPASGVKTEVLATTENVRLISAMAQCTWTVQPTPLEIHVDVDGKTMTFGKSNPATATWYYAYITALGQDANQVLTTSHQSKAFLLEGKSVKVEVELTGGTYSNILCRLQYATWDK